MKYEFLILHPSAFIPTRSPGEVRRNKRSITLSLSPKRCSTTPARRKNENTEWGTLLCRGRHRGGLLIQARTCACLSKPSTLNLTYSLVKEQTKSRQTRVRMFSDKQRANSFEFDLFLSPAARQ